MPKGQYHKYIAKVLNASLLAQKTHFYDIPQTKIKDIPELYV